MKPFDLKKALAGEPVLLRDGSKAIIFYCIPDLYKNEEGNSLSFPVIGLVLDQDGYVSHSPTSWRGDGSYGASEIQEHDKDIIGMYEEPKLMTEEIMEKSFNEDLIVRHPFLNPIDKGFKVVGKMKNGGYILQDCDTNIMQPLHIFNKNMQWTIED